MTEKIILWDIDKTLIDPFYEARQQALHCWEHYVQKQYPRASALEESELSLPDQAALYIKSLEGDPAQNLKPLAQVFAERLKKRDIPAQLEANKILTAMQEISLPKTPHFYTGAIAVLEKLRSKGIRCGIVTARKQEKVWQHHPIRNFVDESLVFTKDSADKTTPEGRQALIQQLHAKAPNAEFLMIGDQPCDAHFAADLGAHYIQPLYGNDQAYLDKIKPEIDSAAAIITKSGYHANTAATMEELVNTINYLGFGEPLNYQKSADHYNAGRPDYPTDQVQAVLNKLGLTKDSVVIDIGAGTGKLTKAIAPFVKKVICVEPDEAMRKELTALNLPNIQIHATSAQNMAEIAQGSIDAIIMGDAAHHLDAAEVLPEFHRVLKSDKKIAVFTRRPDPTSPVVQEVHAILSEEDPNYRKSEAFKIIEVGESFKKKQGTHLVAEGSEILAQPLVEHKTQTELWEYIMSRKWSKHWAETHPNGGISFDTLFAEHADAEGKTAFPRISYVNIGTLKSLEQAIEKPARGFTR